MKFRLKIGNNDQAALFEKDVDQFGNEYFKPIRTFSTKSDNQTELALVEFARELDIVRGELEELRRENSALRGE